MIANRLKSLRLERSIKQSDLAKDLSVSQSTISGWESGRYEIDNHNLCKIADYFSVSIDYLLYHQESILPNVIDLAQILVKDNICFNGHIISEADKELVRQILQRLSS